MQARSIAVSGDGGLEAVTPAPRRWRLQGGAAAGESELPAHWPSGSGDGGAEPRPPRAPKPCALTLAGKAQHHLLTFPSGSLLALWTGQGGRVEGALGYESGDKCPRSCSAPSAQESDIPLLSPSFSLRVQLRGPVYLEQAR